MEVAAIAGVIAAGADFAAGALAFSPPKVILFYYVSFTNDVSE